VHIPDGQNQQLAVDTLRSFGAKDLEEADGTWQAGTWIDFDPTRPPRRIGA
jgi:hypothetical protein